MKKIFFLIVGTLLLAQTLDFESPILVDINNTEKNISADMEKKEKNITENIEIFNENFYSQNSKVSFALIVDKQKFFKYLPSIVNSINVYLIQKGVDFNISLYNNDINISAIPQNYIIDIETNKSKILTFGDYNKTFFIPTFNKNDFNQTFENVYFGGLNFKDQINLFNNFINDRLFTISQNNQISKKLLYYETKNPFFVRNFYFPDINYNDLNNSFTILNTDISKSAQVLSTITSKEIEPFLVFSPQLCYSPAIIFLTQKKDREKLIIANSIINPPLEINDYATLLNSDIKYNWLNYATDILVNKIYNMQNAEDMFYMNDFHIYIFENQINYKTKLYKVDTSFKEVK
ncbi:conserved hypothetical protein [Lebetimonas natsushimae]|uniref:Periplasmic protein n=1 Tax=Lebetimonas natsushimae TaxID=1936991 RepID=A0A292YCY8_9BACT|nr:hypothetical protein [Lebetimonas natsushimae]GAX87210.1 conserved hypothetical protein [Lebetimonas natsushimae]